MAINNVSVQHNRGFLPVIIILHVEPMLLLSVNQMPRCVMFGEMMGGAGCVGGKEKERVDGVFT